MQKESIFSMHKECDEAYESSHFILWLDIGETFGVKIESGNLNYQGTQMVPASFMGFLLQGSHDSVIFCSESRKIVQEGSIVTYEKNMISHNSEIDLKTGTFTAPIGGFYFFTFEFFKDRFVQKVKLHFLHNSRRVRTVAQCNYTQSEWGRHDEDNSSNSYIGLLQQGDTFCIELEEGLLSSGADLHFSAILMGYLIDSKSRD